MPKCLLGSALFAWPAHALAMALCMAALAWPVAGQDRYRDREGGWQKQAVPAPGSSEGELQAIRKALAEGRGGDAYKMADGWIGRHPNDPLLVEAYLLRADAQVAQRDYYDALYDYEIVIRDYPASEQFNTALEREYEIARLYAGGVNRKFLGFEILPAEDEAAEVFLRIQERAPGSDLGEKASMALGDMYMRLGDMGAAADAYDMFLVNYPRSPQRERVMLQLIQANLAQFRGPRFDPKGLLEARTRLERYQREFPAAAERIGAEGVLVRIDEAEARKVLHLADWYRGQNERVSAVYMYRRVIKDFPRTAAAREAVERLSGLSAGIAAPVDRGGVGRAVRPASQPATDSTPVGPGKGTPKP